MGKGRFRGVGGTLVLDAEGLSKLAAGDPRARAWFEQVRGRQGHVVTAASTLAEVLRGSGDTRTHIVLRHIDIADVTGEAGRKAGELLGDTRLSGHRCALDALLAVMALDQQRPVVLLTSDPKDMTRLTEEPGRHARDRVAVVRI